MTATPMVRLEKVLTLSDSAVSSANLNEINLAGVYSFGRGLFKRGPLSPGETTYKSYNRLVTDEFVISQPKAWEGAIARITEEFDGWYLSPVFPTFRVDKQKVVPRYLEWFCKQEPVWIELQQKSRGIGARRELVSPDQFLSLEIPLPPLPEQRRIVARIESLAGKLKEAEGLRQQVKLQATALVTSIHTELSGDRTTTLGEILELDENQVVVSATSQYPQVGIKSFGGGLFRKSAVTGMETTYKVFNRLYDGAIVLSQVKAWEGATAVCGNDLAGWFVSPEYRTFRCNSEACLPGYMSALVRTEWFWSKLSNATRGVGARRERTRPEQFLALEIPMPTIDLQQKGQALFERVEAIQPLQSNTATELAALMPSILDKAFKGEL